MQPGLTNQSGVTLIEATVSLLVFSVGVLGLSQIQSYTHWQIKDQRQRNMAIWKGHELIERIKGNSSVNAIEAYKTAINNQDNWCADQNVPATICADNYDGVQKIAAQSCDTIQLATYDSWDVICNGDDSLVQQLDGLRVALQCSFTAAGNPCNDTEDIVLTIIWDGKIATADSRLGGQTLIIQSEQGIASADRNLVIAASDNYFRQVFRP